MKGIQKERLARWIADRFEISSLGNVLLYCDERGFPIRAEDVTVGFSMRAFL
jgi:hypothetical protein